MLHSLKKDRKTYRMLVAVAFAGVSPVGISAAAGDSVVVDILQM